MQPSYQVVGQAVLRDFPLRLIELAQMFAERFGPLLDQLAALLEWSCEQITRQTAGGEPTPWPGPF